MNWVMSIFGQDRQMERDRQRYEAQCLRREYRAAARQGFADAQAKMASKALHLQKDRPDLANAYHRGYEKGQEAPRGSINPFEMPAE